MSLEHAEAYFFGLDLGRRKDYSAITIVARRPEVPDPKAPDYSKIFNMYYAVYLRRYELQTPYHEVVEEVARLWKLPELKSARQFMVVDQTGVGDAVIDEIRRVHHVPATGIVITGGERVTQPEPNEYHVPKSHIVTTMVRMVQAKRLKVLPGVKHQREFFEELDNFGYKLNRDTGKPTYEALQEKIHDDLVIAVALPLWYAETCMPSRIQGGRRAHIAEDYDPLGRKRGQTER